MKIELYLNNEDELDIYIDDECLNEEYFYYSFNGYTHEDADFVIGELLDKLEAYKNINGKRDRIPLEYLEGSVKDKELTIKIINDIIKCRDDDNRNFN
jgi:hypothetical protein